MIINLEKYEFKIDKFFKTISFINKKNLKQNDIRDFEIEFYENGKQLNIENFNIEVRWVKPDKKFVDMTGTAITKNANVATFKLNPQCTKVPGINHMEISISKDGYINSSWTIDIYVEPSILTGSAGVSKNVSNLLDELTTANTNANNTFTKVTNWSNAHKNVDNLINDVNSIKNKVDKLDNTKADKTKLDTVNARIDNFAKLQDGIKNEVDELNNTKADKTKLDTVNARIDSFTHLAEGSTTGDAELIDARIMANGIVADTLGESIRTQMNNTEKKFNDFTNATMSYLMPFKKLSGEYYDRNNHNVSNYATSYLIDLDYYNGASVKISTSVPKGVNYVTFLDKDSKVISYKRNETQDTEAYADTSVYIPNGAKYLVVGGLYNNNPRLYVKGCASDLKNLVKELEFLKESELRNEESFQLTLDCFQGNLDNDHKPSTYAENAFSRLHFKLPEIKKDMILEAKEGYSFTVNGDWKKKALITQKDLPMWLSIKKDTNEDIKQNSTFDFLTINVITPYKKMPKKEVGMIDITDEFIFKNEAYATDSTTGQLIYKTSYDDKILNLLANKRFEDASIYVEADEGYKVSIDEFISEEDKYYRKFKYPSTKHPFKSWIQSGYFNVYADRTYFITIKKDDNSPISPSRIPICIYKVDNKIHIPSYYQQYINSKVGVINNLQQGKNTFSFTFITDIHIQHNAKHCFPLIKKINNQCAIRDTLGCGDWATAWLSDAEGIEGLKRDLYELKDLFSGIPIIKAIGNHDWAYGGSNQFNITNEDAYNSYYRDCATNNITFGGNGTYFYKDDLINKIRYISVNVMDYLGSTTPDNANNKEFIFRVSEEQKNWLKREALNMPADDWCCVIFSHLLPWTSSEFPFTSMGTLVENGGDLEKLANQFISKSGDFSNYKGNIVCWIGGHEHNDAIVKNGNLNMISVNGDCIIKAENAPDRALNTISEQAFDVFTIDKTSKSVHITRIGAGTDRTFNYL